MIAEFGIGLASGLLVGIAVFSYAFSRAVALGLIAGAIAGGIMVAGVEGYVRWAANLPTGMTGLSAFWIGLIGGILGGAFLWAERRVF